MKQNWDIFKQKVPLYLKPIRERPDKDVIICLRPDTGVAGVTYTPLLKEDKKAGSNSNSQIEYPLGTRQMPQNGISKFHETLLLPL